MDAIVTRGLSKRYGSVTALEPLDLSVRAGELFTLLGLNGAGKSTLIKLLCCLSKPSEGDALLFGRSIANETAVKRLIGVSPQETALAPSLSVRENLLMLAGIYGLSRKARQERLDALVRRFSLKGVLDRRAGRLSGGWQRRVSIAMALVGEPSVLFLDEPTLGLDVLARRELWGVISELRGSCTVLLTTHYMEEAE
ncbi:MAG: ABC transporter ATP-binding protein, partial [Clostridia bacterium]|nr:ABC transporter ATP-binding protein [Clostridia bacterium]